MRILPNYREINDELNELKLRIAKMNARRNAQMNLLQRNVSGGSFRHNVNLKPSNNNRRMAFNDPWLYPSKLTHRWRSSSLDSLLLDKYYDTQDVDKKSVVIVPDDDIEKYKRMSRYTANADLLSKLRDFVQEQERQLTNELLNKRRMGRKQYLSATLPIYKDPSNTLSPKREPPFLNPINKKDNFYKRYNAFVKKILKPSRKSSPVKQDSYYKAPVLKYRPGTSSYFYNSRYDKMHPSSLDDGDYDTTLIYKPRWYRYSSPAYRRYLRDVEYMPKVHALTVPQDVESIIRRSEKGNLSTYDTNSDQFFLSAEPTQYSPFESDSYLKSSLPSWKQYYYTQKLKSKPSNERFLDYYDPYYDFFRDSASVDLTDELVSNAELPSQLPFQNTEKLVDEYRDAIYEDIIQNLRNKQSQKYTPGKISSRKNESAAEALQKDRIIEPTFASAFLRGYLSKDKPINAKDDILKETKLGTDVSKELTNRNNSTVNGDMNYNTRYQTGCNFTGKNDYRPEKDSQAFSQSPITHFYPTDRSDTQNGDLTAMNYSIGENEVYNETMSAKYNQERNCGQQHFYQPKESVSSGSYLRKYPPLEDITNKYDTKVKDELLPRDFRTKNTNESAQPIQNHEYEENPSIKGDNTTELYLPPSVGKSQKQYQSGNAIPESTGCLTAVSTSDVKYLQKHPTQNTFVDDRCIASFTTGIHNKLAMENQKSKPKNKYSPVENNQSSEIHRIRLANETNNVAINQSSLKNGRPPMHETREKLVDPYPLKDYRSIEPPITPSISENENQPNEFSENRQRIETPRVRPSIEETKDKLKDIYSVKPFTNEKEDGFSNKISLENRQQIEEQRMKPPLCQTEAELEAYENKSVNPLREIEHDLTTRNLPENKLSSENRGSKYSMLENEGKYAENYSSQSRQQTKDNYSTSFNNETENRVNENDMMGRNQNQRMKPHAKELESELESEYSSKNQPNIYTTAETGSKFASNMRRSSEEQCIEEDNYASKYSTKNKQFVENNPIRSKINTGGGSANAYSSENRQSFQTQPIENSVNETGNKSSSRFMENETVATPIRQADDNLINAYNSGNRDTENEFPKLPTNVPKPVPTNIEKKYREYPLADDLSHSSEFYGGNVDECSNQLANESATTRRPSSFRNRNSVENERSKEPEKVPLSRRNSAVFEHGDLYANQPVLSRKSSVKPVLSRKNSIVQPSSANKRNAFPKMNDTKYNERFKKPVMSSSNSGNSCIDETYEGDIKISDDNYKTQYPGPQKQLNANDRLVDQNVTSKECPIDDRENVRYYDNNNYPGMVTNPYVSDYNSTPNEQYHTSSDRQVDHFYDEYPNHRYEENSKDLYGHDNYRQDYNIGANELQGADRGYDPNQYYTSDYNDTIYVSDGKSGSGNLYQGVAYPGDEGYSNSYNLNYDENYIKNEAHQRNDVYDDSNRAVYYDQASSNVNYREPEYINDQNQYQEQYVEHYSDNVSGKESNNPSLSESYPNQYLNEQQASEYSLNSVNLEPVIQDPENDEKEAQQINSNINEENQSTKSIREMPVEDVSVIENPSGTKQTTDTSKSTGEVAAKEIKRRASKNTLSPNEEKKTKAQSQNSEVQKRMSKPKLTENKFKRLANNVKNKTVLKKP